MGALHRHRGEVKERTEQCSGDGGAFSPPEKEAGPKSNKKYNGGLGNQSASE